MTTCPRCMADLTDREIRAIWASRNSLRRKVYAGGRPPNANASADAPRRSRKPKVRPELETGMGMEVDAVPVAVPPGTWEF